jgi:hypothetical protein
MYYQIWNKADVTVSNKFILFYSVPTRERYNFTLTNKTNAKYLKFQANTNQ